MLVEVVRVDRGKGLAQLVQLPDVPARGDYLQLRQIAFPLRVRRVILLPLQDGPVARLEVGRVRAAALVAPADTRLPIPRQWEESRAARKPKGVTVQLRGAEECRIAFVRTPRLGECVEHRGELLEAISPPISGTEFVHVFVATTGSTGRSARAAKVAH